MPRTDWPMSAGNRSHCHSPAGNDGDVRKIAIVILPSSLLSVSACSDATCRIHIQPTSKNKKHQTTTKRKRTNKVCSVRPPRRRLVDADSDPRAHHTGVDHLRDPIPGTSTVAPHPQKRYCGLSPRNALIALVVAIVVILAIVGGTLGGVLAPKHGSDANPAPPAPSPSSPTLTPSSSSSTSSSTTSSSSSAAPIPTSGILALNCPAINGTQYTSPAGPTKYTFLLLCQTDFKARQSDIASSRAGSFDACLDSCATRNNANLSPPCQGLTIDANLTAYSNVNCFLKTAITSTSPYTLDSVLAGALLLNLTAGCVCYMYTIVYI